ncbi:ubiquitin conjugating enzyme [Chrysochromulina tobinii]|uniref:E2 ubiquitin-conjugating enzyme n=1 Tax=Chrysochromulina tobinii TaxID=1460289 RepID=A0A0M0JIS8_9EUKA|nr:ubiquitin conjugating enzyme [Chrysochromulina tobinii]|eukprot:KOO26486.1 ubiquitin conjugating enzyme [Chrysochromulina sp. CCMP291]
MAAAVDLNRVKKELKDCNKDPETSGIKAELVHEDDYLHWKGTIKGPITTPYEGGIFDVDILLPNDYPFVPPKMKFITKCWHPNISSDSGAICLDILKTEWSPALTIRTALISLQALLSAAEPDDPQDAVVAKQYKEHHQEFMKTAKFWTETYAGAQAGDSEKLEQLMSMGFEKAKCVAALSKAKGDVNAATEALLSDM